jgi:hypothetical protein
MTEKISITRRSSGKRTGRKFAKLVAFLTARLDSQSDKVRREAADTLAKVLMHIDEMEDRRSARTARAKADIPEPVSVPVDPAQLADHIAKLKAQAQGVA